MDITLRQLEYFRAVAAAGSLNEAAKAAHVSPSALSLALTEMERALGMPLTVRDRRSGTALTAAGRSVLARAQSILEEVEALASMGDDAGPVTGAVTLGVTRSLIGWSLPRLLPALSREHPDLRVDVQELGPLELQDRLISGALEVGIVHRAHVREHTLELTELHPLRICAVVPRGHPAAALERVSLAALSDERFILKDQEPALWNTLRMFDTAGLRPHIRWTIPDTATVLALVAQGEGASVLTGGLLPPGGGADVVFVPLVEGPISNAAVLATGPRPARRAVLAVREAARRVLGED